VTSNTAGVGSSQEDAPVSGFPAVSGQGAPVKSRKSWSPSLATALRSLRMARLGGGGDHGLRSWGCSTAETGRQRESSLAPGEAVNPKRGLDLHSRSLFSKEI
jgi:hypothetical protein